MSAGYPTQQPEDLEENNNLKITNQAFGEYDIAFICKVSY